LADRAAGRDGGELVALDGSTFFVSDLQGDVDASGDARGFFFRDMRHLSIWRLHVNGSALHLLTGRAVDYFALRILATLAGARVGLNPAATIRRDRFVSDGVHEDLAISNNSEQEMSLSLSLEFGSDFADIFEVKQPQPKKGTLSAEVEGPRSVRLSYQRGTFRRGTVIEFSAPGQLSERSVRFDIWLPPRSAWRCCVDVYPICDGEMHRPSIRCGSPAKPRPKMPKSLDEWLDEAPRVECGWDVIKRTYVQSLVDLAALRFRPMPQLTWSLPAAGLPWFMALFGRDSLITSYQALPFHPELATTTLEALSALQASGFDDFRDAEPGKILHELRCGELATLHEAPHTPYYGTHDATCLFLILLDEYERWTADQELVSRLKPQALAAIEWMRLHGDLDGDGYLEYRTRSTSGLVNQGWKDSWNSMLFANGEIARPPIATCEIQGYAYDARIRSARLARAVWDEPELASALEAEAARLKEAFNRDYWSAERGHYLLALDGEKRPVDSMASNAGHLLWSGIVDEGRAAPTVERLMATDMYTGWGIRTISARDAGYNPIEYHNGTVWPHDTGLVAEGMRRYGFHEQASTLALGLFEAAQWFAYRLPEVFAGLDRPDTEMPVEYPRASRPQAWSAGAPLLALRTLLGLDPGPRLRASPHLPAEVADLAIRGIHHRRASVDAP
jgi:glycogen debranching enzyme